MTGDMQGLDKLTARRRRVTPPRNPGTPIAARSPTVGAAPADAAVPPPAAPATRGGRRAPDPLVRGGATEQLGVRIHGSQMRRLRRAVRLLDEDEGIYRPTQAELIQALIEDLPDSSGADIARLADKIRRYRLRVSD